MLSFKVSTFKFVKYILVLIILACFQILPAQSKNYTISSIGFYNLENLFDTLDTPEKNDLEFTPAGTRVWNSDKYYAKLENLARVISEMCMENTKEGISVLGVAEVENRAVLEDLVAQPRLRDRNLQIVHYESTDRRGIDVGLLYNPAHFSVLHSEIIPMDIIEKGEKLYTRDILYVRGKLGAEEIHILVNHWPSRRGSEKRTAKFRNSGAQICKQLYDSLYEKDPNVKFFVMGDLNDDPTNASVTKYLSAKGDKSKVREGDMFNPMYTFYKKGYGSNAYRDAWSLFDQIIVSKSLVTDEHNGFFFYKAEIFKPDYIIEKKGKYKGYPLRTFSGDTFINGFSDHFPVCVYLLKEI